MAFQLGASSSFSFSSSSIPRWTHDVFLSFRGEDIRQNFISHLYEALHQRGINTYMDNNIERGEEISPELFKAIEGSMISIVVLSKNYSDSRWCLDELLKIIECKETVKQIHVLPLFYNVDPSDVRHQKGSFGEAFSRVEHKFEADTVKLTKWKAALEEIANLTGFKLGDRNESEFIQDIIKWVDSKMVGRTRLKVAKYPVGIESRVRDIYARLNMGRSDIICMVGIFGTGGIGKTTISKAIHNRISDQFEGIYFLKNIRETTKAGGLIQLQKTLLYDILGIRSEFHDTDKGINVIRHRLCSKKVLLILDDVDDLVQIETLAGAHDWFGPGSRIIITTRDQHLLNNPAVDSKYELFSLHAFGRDEPFGNYVDLSKVVIKYAQGLPLALTVVGSYLKGQYIQQWKSALDKYKRIPNGNIQKVLLVSYEGLDSTEKEMFLDIACFFKGEPLAYVTKIFDGCDFFPGDGFHRLVNKCLITIEGNIEYIWMHNLLQDMGREIVREESPKKPSKRSRLWFHEDVRQVLEESSKISVSCDYFRDGNFSLVFINCNARFSCGLNYLPDNSRVLDWSEYPSQSLPHNFQGKKLIAFRMRDSFIKELGNGFRPKNLGTLAFYNCKFFKIPDLSSTSNLKELSVEYCLRLFQVHDSVGSLENLSDLSFEGCSALQILPKSLKLRSLRKLRLGNCSSLVELPEIECITESLSRLDLGGTAIEELPLSIRNLIGLEHLVLSRCKNLMRLPNACTQLQHLREVCIGGCTNIAKKMRDDDGQSLLPIESTTTKDFILSSDEQLHESNFFPISSFFTMFTSVSTLHRLDLSGTEIVSLPLSIKGLVSLINLELHNCQKLKEILVLPPNIKEVDVSQCESLERFAEVSKGLYDFDATLLPENQIPDWLSYVHEFLDNEMVKGHDEEWEIDIEGPLYLEEISGIVLYVVVFFKDAWSWQGIIDNAKITIAGSNRVCQIQNGVELLNMDWLNIGGTGYDVWVGYSNLQSFDLKVLPNLLVQFDLRRCDPGRVPFYQSCRAKVVYKDERREKKKTKIEADIAKSPDQQQLN
ncbi:hypothetical protein CIPAW_15G169500 [Carya illinoinensis]|uniref:TIR domain-containing protein n=1 Tax=Carya illinoinensis TaxID=32201 RepID=A0A8T1NCD3_CARIL|nr:hypothetical protein CIPAW_15G169500 [Carya illinoinensis]